MLIQGRDIQLAMFKNFGNNDMSVSINLTPFIKKDGISSITKTLEQMFKIDHSNLSIECKNVNGGLWTFINDTLDVANALYPPWVFLSVDNKPYFLGLINLDSLTRDCKNESIKIAAQDWSKQLSNKFLTEDSWSRKLSIQDVAQTAADYNCFSDSYYFIQEAYKLTELFCNTYVPGDGPWGYVPMVYNTVRPKSKVYFPIAMLGTIKANMKVSFPSLFGSKIFTIESAQIVDWRPITGFAPYVYYLGDIQQQLEVVVGDGFEWPAIYNFSNYGSVLGRYGTSPAITMHVEAIGYSADLNTYEELLQDYPINSGDKIHRLRIGVNLAGSSVAMVNRLQVGDNVKITLANGSLQETKIVAIDYFTREYVMQDDLSGPANKGGNVYLNADDIKTIYHKNAKDLILQALNGTANVDFTKFTKPTLSKYMLSSLGVPTYTGEPCIATNIDVNNSSFHSQFIVNKNVGYSTTNPRFSLDANDYWQEDYSLATNTANEFAEAYINWSDQLVSAPSKLLPNNLYTEFPTYTGRISNHNYMDYNYVDFANGLTPYGQTKTHGMMVWDYTAFRAWKFTQNGEFNTNLAYSNFTTSYAAFSTPTTLGIVFSACIFKDIPSSLGTGYAVLVSNGTGSLTVYNGTSNPTYSSTNLKNAHLKTTPYGTYVITKTGIGKVTYSAGSLSVAFCNISTDNDTNTLTLFPNMFCHLNSTSNYIIGVFTTKVEDVINTEARLLELSSTIDTSPTLTVKSEEKSFTFVSSMGRLEKDPFNDRLLMVYDGRAYQVSKKVSLVIERLKADGMNALELIEYICQITGAMAIPNAKGYLDIVSVNYKTTAMPITVGINTKSQNRLNKYFFSVIRVNGIDDSVYADAFGYEGNQSFEISSHPLIFTTSQCAALADNLVLFYGYPRKEETHTWKQPADMTSPFFEALELFQIVTINGDTQQWYITNLSFDLINKKASVKLLEVI